jgi:calcineurin-like phosphoesterase family protein
VHSGPYSTSGKDIQRCRILFPTQYDVGVDNNNFTPVSFWEVKEKIEKQISLSLL